VVGFRAACAGSAGGGCCRSSILPGVVLLPCFEGRMGGAPEDTAGKGCPLGCSSTDGRLSIWLRDPEPVVSIGEGFAFGAKGLSLNLTASGLQFAATSAMASRANVCANERGLIKPMTAPIFYSPARREHTSWTKHPVSKG
jgi:hypothetical protein